MEGKTAPQIADILKCIVQGIHMLITARQRMDASLKASVWTSSAMSSPTQELADILGQRSVAYGLPLA